jgi:integrase
VASIYKRSGDSKNKHLAWLIGFSDENGVRRTVKGFTDKGHTERLAAKLEHEVMLRRRGLIDPEMESFAAKRRRPLSEHLKAFEKSLGTNTGKHVKLVMSRVRRVVEGIAADTLGDLTTERVEEFLRELAGKERLGNRTYNHYVQAIDEFCRWLVQKKRIASNPVLGLKRLNTEVDVRHRRRALNAAEIARLVKSARESHQEIQCFDGEARARIYIIAYLTGLRRSEIGSLTPESFRLDNTPPTVTVEAAFSKHRRRDVIPLHPELVAMLYTWLPEYPTGEVLFPKLGKRRTWLMVKKDLERIGIAYETADGIADFHAAGRHSHITELLRSGASLPEAKELARHSDIKMTMRYTHIGIGDQAKALRQLPWAGASTNENGSDPASDEPAAGQSKASGPNTEASTKAADGAQHSSSESGVAGCHNAALGDTGKSSPETTQPLLVTGVDADFHDLSPDGKEWRRRESNPRPVTFPRRLLRA